MSPVSDFPLPYPVQFTGNRWARWVLSMAGWTVNFRGLPEQRGVLIVYPHTSNWDFVVMMLAKWSLGVPVMFWGKDRLFRVPLLGRWLTWLGGVPVDRTSPRGVTAQALTLFESHRKSAAYFWLGLAPEGTRKYIPGLRSGFYRAAYGANVPLGVVRLDYAHREIRVLDFIRLSGDAQADTNRLAAIYEGVSGRRPENAAPLVLLDASVSRADTIVK